MVHLASQPQLPTHGFRSISVHFERENKFWAAIWATIWAAIWATIWAAIWAAIWASIWAAVWTTVSVTVLVARSTSRLDELSSGGEWISERVV